MPEPTALDTLRAALLADNRRDRDRAATHARLAEEQPAPPTGPRSASFAEHRVLAFVHHWLALLGHPSEDAEPLRELLAPDLEMTLTEGRVLHTFDEVAAWYANARAQVGLSTHHLVDPVVTDAGDGNYRITMDFGWQGIAGGTQPMTARTRHDWTLAETGERYPRLRRFAVTALQPFTPVTAEEALADHAAARAA